MDESARGFPVAFGQRLRRCRRNRDRTQAEIAAAIGMERAQYSQVEGGRYLSMQLEKLAKLADTLNTSVDYLLLRTDEDPGVIPPLGCPAEGRSLDGTTPLPATLLHEEVAL